MGTFGREGTCGDRVALGGPAALNAYDARGIPNVAPQARFGYTGQAWLPELGMYYYKARIYSPTLGRFLQTDPIGYEDNANLYAYTGNDPVNRADPTGEFGEPGENMANFADWAFYEARRRGAPDAEARYRLARDRATTLRGRGDHAGAEVTLNEDVRSRPTRLENANRINFSQRTVSENFRDSHTLDGTVNALRNRTLAPENIPPIRVYTGSDGRLVTLDNRRLLAAQLAGTPINVVNATADEVQDVTSRQRRGSYCERPTFSPGRRRR